jgi:hypothetical protein
MAYTTGMSFFVESTTATAPKTKNIRPISLGLAAVFIVMAVAQLFTFETFPKVIADMWLPGGGDVAPIRAAVIVTLEVVALPFLLGMRLSPAMRIVSMVAGWMVVAAWFVATLWVNMAANIATSSGLLGDTVTLPIGWWNVLFCLSLGVLAVWAAWGMWPIANAKRKH